MRTIINRLISATRVLFIRRILLIEAHRGPNGRDQIIMWGTMPDKPEEIRVLRALADSIERTHQLEERARLVNTSKQIN
jgi:transcriptional regulator GlxA family with amidase domain